MKKTLFNLIVVLSYIYSIGYILFDFPTDTYTMRAVHGVMTTICSCSLLYFVLRFFENRKSNKEGGIKS